MAITSTFTLSIWHSKKKIINYIPKSFHYQNAFIPFTTAGLAIARNPSTSEILTEELQGNHEKYSIHTPEEVILEEVPIKGNVEISQKGGIYADSYTYGRLLHECVHGKNLAKGKELHAYMIKTGFETDPFLDATLVNFYVKCGTLEDARQVFDKMTVRRLVSCNNLLAGYSQQGRVDEALRLFREMEGVNMKVDEYTFVSVLKVCTVLRAIESGKQVHAHIVKSGLHSNSILMTALVDIYAKCGRPEDARQVFDETSLRDVVLWSAIIVGFVQQGNCRESLNLFSKMSQAGVQPNMFTFRSVFKACAGLEALEQGKQIHAKMVKIGIKLHLVLGNGLLDMYAKCECLESALSVYEKMSQKDVVSCNTMISGYTLQGHDEEALKFFSQLQQMGIRPDEFTFAGALGACASLASMQQGKQVHACIIKSGFESDVVLGSTIVDTYAKCGSIEEARQVFDLMPRKDVVLWTVIITAYAKHGFAKEAIELFEEMKQLGVKPDHVTFLAILSACSYAGLMDKGWHYFHVMTRDHSILPRVGHYASMVDLLCRGGLLNEACDFIQNMPVDPTATAWGALLRACQLHGDTKLGKLAAKHLLELDPQNSGCYVALSNIHANDGNWGDTFQMRKTMKDIGSKKEPGCSWIEVKNRVHVFPAGGRTHSGEIDAML